LFVEFTPKPEAQSELRTKANYILRIACSEQRPPVHLGRRRAIQEAAGGAGKKCLQAGKGSLPVLAEVDCFIRLKLLEPGAETELVRTVGQSHAIFIRIQIAVDIQVASVVASGQANLRLRVRRRASAHHHGAHQLAGEKAGHIDRRRAWCWFAGEKVACPRIAETGRIEQPRRYHVSLLQADDLLPQIQ
jgi:hypothetical protein